MSNLLEQRVADVSRRFQAKYGAAPKWIVAAPGRVNLIGEHIDYSDGFVLPMALDRYTVIAAGPAEGEHATFASDRADEEAVISLAAPKRNENRGHWSNYVAGVIAGCLARGMRPAAFRALVGSDVPLGGGLSSSAALEVATATLVEAITGTELDPVEKALLCQKAEHDYPGMPCGIMDQFASTLCTADHLMLLDCRSREVELIPFTDPALTVLIINSNVKHELAGGEYAERRGQCEAASKKLGVASPREATLEQLEAARDKLSPLEYQREHHAIAEIARTRAAAEAMKSGEWLSVGRHMDASHASLRDDYNVSCSELDLLVELAHQIGLAGGVYGSRMTGGGFGGCTVTLAATDKVDAIASQIATDYERQTGIQPTVLTSRPSRGAHVVFAP